MALHLHFENSIERLFLEIVCGNKTHFWSSAMVLFPTSWNSREQMSSVSTYGDIFLNGKVTKS